MFIKPVAAEVAAALAPHLDEVAKRAEKAVDTAMTGFTGAVVVLTTGNNHAVTTAMTDAKALIGVRARVDFTAEEIRALTRRFDSLEATAIGIAGGTLAAIAFFQGATKTTLGQLLVLILLVPFITSAIAIRYRLKDPNATLLATADQDAFDTLKTAAPILEQLYKDNFAITRARGWFIQVSLNALVLLVLALLGVMVYSS